MKRQLMLLGLACASFGLFASSARAQEYRIVTKIPFDFTVGNTTCPAGVYDLQAESLANFEKLHNQSGKCSLFIASRRYLRESAGKPRLVFRRYGQNYFLTKVWNGQGAGSTVPAGRHEKQLRDHTPPAEIATTVVNGLVGQ